MKEIKELENLIIYHKSLYYRGEAKISDFEFDKLEEELRKLDPNSYALTKVGFDFFSEDKIEHENPMLSLNKTYKFDELIKWTQDKEVVSTFKIDGSSCSLVYQNGVLEVAKTRGDGRFGENIKPKASVIESIPNKINKYNSSFEVRGEIYCTEISFINLCHQMTADGFDKPTSQRNIVAGLLGRKDTHYAGFLSFKAYELISNEIKLETEVQKFKVLEEMGFSVPDFTLNKNIKELEERIKEAESFMSEGDYLIDGIVFSFNDLKLHDTMGETSHHPRYKMAFKFEGETKTTKIKEIIWQVSRNGILTPVALVEPVYLSNALVSRVTLHNFGLVKLNNLKIGDTIEIVRSGEVIPKFLGVVLENKNKEFSYPEFCPSCDSELIIQDIRLLCTNPHCKEKIKEEILHFISRMGITDLNTKRVEDLLKSQIIKSIPDLYKIKEDDLLKVDKIKDKLAHKILKSIEESKEQTLSTFLAALGISGGALNKCQKIVENGFNTLEKVMNLKASELMNIESFAEKSSNEFIDSLREKIPLIKELLFLGLKIKEEIKIKESKISGLKICITGTLSMKRADLQKLIRINGGINVTSVSSETNYLLTNDQESSSSKFKKSKELGIKIINEEDFLKLLEE